MRLDRSPLLASARHSGRTTPALLALAMALFIVIGSVYATVPVLYGVLSLDDRGLPPLAVFAADLGSTFALTLVLLCLWMIFFERRGPAQLFGETDGFTLKAARGAVVGLSLSAGTILILALLGFVSLGSDGASASPVGFSALAGVFAAGLVWAFQATVEELASRGWLLTTAANQYRVPVGVVLSSFAFALWHVATTADIGFLAAVNLFLVSVFWCIYALREGSLVGVCAAHAVYNWSESNLFGLDYYGEAPVGGSLLKLQQTGPDFLTGGGVGANTTGGLAFTVVVLVALAAVAVVERRSTKGNRALL